MNYHFKNATTKLFTTLLLLATILLATPTYAQDANNTDYNNGFLTYDPFRLFEQFSSFVPRNFMPQVDIFETKDAYIIKANVPGVNPENINITVDNNVLTISGNENTQALEQSEGKYYKKERFSGEFIRQFYLPNAIDSDNIQASNENGVLTITIPKQESAQPRTIEIQN